MLRVLNNDLLSPAALYNNSHQLNKIIFLISLAFSDPRKSLGNKSKGFSFLAYTHFKTHTHRVFKVKNNISN